MNLTLIEQQTSAIVADIVATAKLSATSLLVVGCSTSEVLGNPIGKGGDADVATAIFRALSQAQGRHGFSLAFQCCEHLNRALVVERAVHWARHLEEVTVIPVARAGGSMAAHAFRHLNEPVVVETVRADAGVDIGGTLIGMHLKPVAVPIRLRARLIGEAHVIAAYSRPKLIGGARAVYSLEAAGRDEPLTSNRLDG